MSDKQRPNSLTHLKSFEELYIKYLTHFNSKTINSYNPTIPARIKMNNENRSIPYIALSTLGADISDLDFNKNASELPPVKKLKALWSNEDGFKEYLESEKSKIEERLDKLNAKPLKNQDDLDSINKCHSDISNIDLDITNVDLIKKTYNKESYFYEKINEETVFCEGLTPLVKQLLVFSEKENDYISLSPLSAIGLNDKIMKVFSSRIKKIKNLKTGEEKEYERYYKVIPSAIGGNQPQNISSLPASVLNFRLYTPTPKFIDEYYSTIWKYIHSGIEVYFNKEEIQIIKAALNKYNQIPTQQNEEKLRLKLYKITQRLFNKTLYVKRLLNDVVIEEFGDEIKGIMFNNSALYTLINSEISKDELWNGILNKINKSEIKYQYILNDKKEYSSELAQDVINQILHYSRKYSENITLSSELNKKLKEIIKEII